MTYSFDHFTSTAAAAYHAGLKLVWERDLAIQQNGKLSLYTSSRTNADPFTGTPGSESLSLYMELDVVFHMYTTTVEGIDGYVLEGRRRAICYMPPEIVPIPAELVAEYSGVRYTVTEQTLEASSGRVELTLDVRTDNRA